MIVTIDTQNPPDPFGDQNLSPRVKSLIGQFIRDRYANALMANPAIQKEFGLWLDQYYGKRTASPKSQRQEMRMIRAAAERGTHLSTLADDMDARILNSRNPVPNKDINYQLSHLITRDTFERMARYADTDRCTPTQRDGLTVFVASCMTGLRTSEWSNAELDLTPPTQSGEVNAHPTLTVMTAKTRTADDVLPRVLVLDGFSEGNLQVIQSVIQLMRASKSGYKASLVREMRTAMRTLYSDNAEHYELMAHVDYRTARKIFTVESRRGGATQQQTAAALGHTTTVNLRWYAQGDIHCPRKTSIPLARCTRGAAADVRDTLSELNERRQRSGQTPISGYPERPDLAPEPGDDTDNQTGRGNSFLDKL